MCSNGEVLIDTNAYIALINGSEANVRRRFQRAAARKSIILLSSIVAFELWYGVAKSQRKDSNTQRLEAFFAGPLEWTLFDEDDARTAGTVRAELEAIEKPIGAYDVLLAGPVDRTSSSQAKIALFRSLFRGRDDLYPRRFESAECPNRRFLPVTDDVIRWHLSSHDPAMGSPSSPASIRYCGTKRVSSLPLISTRPDGKKMRRHFSTPVVG